MNRQAYIKRIGYEGVIDITDETLTALHRQHVYQVPFESLAEIDLARCLAEKFNITIR